MAVVLGFAANPIVAFALPTGSLGQPISTGAGITPSPQMGAQANQGASDQSVHEGEAPAAKPAADRNVDFEADEVDYSDDDNLVTAKGNVFLRRGERTMRADSVVWNRDTGDIVANGNIRAVDADGNEMFTGSMKVDQDMTVGFTTNMLLLLREGGRLAADKGEKQADGTVLLTRVSYTGCDVVNSKGCATTPSWRINARRVIYDQKRKLVKFKAARLVVFGVPLVPLPTAIIATDGRAISGPLIPDLRTTASNGIEISDAEYIRLADDKDVTVKGYIFSKVDPMLQVNYRQLTDLGAFQLTGYVTRSPVVLANGTAAGTTTGKDQLRGYIDANGKFQLSPEWSVTFSGRLASDRTFLQRYYINNDDLLRSTVNVEHIDRNSYFSLAGWAFQTLRTDELQGGVPIALPVMDYRRRIADPWLGGHFEIEANTLAISRTAGQDTQRAFTSAQYSLRRTTPWGQQFTFTGLARADAYHSTNNGLTATSIYQGLPGWQTRGVVLGAVDMTWPLVGAAFGGTQVITPHVQVVAAPSTPNLSIPNEDSRAIELEDDNLFALNRFPGYDRIEDGTRITYGLEWKLEVPRWSINANVGQSYRMTSKPTLLPDGTGLSGRMSDIVGRTEIRYRDLFKITHRYRLDKDTMGFRRNEIDAAVGSNRTYFEVGYVKLNRHFDPTIEDLQDSTELRAAARVAFARYLSVFGSGILDIDDKTVVNGVTLDKYQPLRTRLGFSYNSDCLEIDLTWRRDYVTIGDVAKGSSFELHFSLKNIGFR
ncbi:LPS-assembly protein LptD [Novosphingobium rosa]|uniref:LPS-assembly protein LptD n=1 Tax=Novosphingobium rosa TaxID=76978 RepID=UPI000A01E650|nr:LPS assembly protein LptD [Novosphingobium rosa]